MIDLDKLCRMIPLELLNHIAAIHEQEWLSRKTLKTNHCCLLRELKDVFTSALLLDRRLTEEWQYYNAVHKISHQSAGEDIRTEILTTPHNFFDALARIRMGHMGTDEDFDVERYYDRCLYSGYGSDN
jgi:hypothetical protein